MPGGVRLHEALGAVLMTRTVVSDVDEANARHAVVEGLAFEQLHRDEGAPVLEPTRVVDVDDVRALDAGRGARLAEEALDDDGARAGELRGEDLHRDFLPSEMCIAS